MESKSPRQTYTPRRYKDPEPDPIDPIESTDSTEITESLEVEQIEEPALEIDDVAPKPKPKTPPPTSTWGASRAVKEAWHRNNQ